MFGLIVAGRLVQVGLTYCYVDECMNNSQRSATALHAVGRPASGGKQVPLHYTSGRESKASGKPSGGTIYFMLTLISAPPCCCR